MSKLNGLFSKGRAKEEARNYENLSFTGKTKNQLIIFWLFVSITSTVFAFVGGYSNIKIEEVLLDVGFYLLLSPFIYFNYRGAIVIACMLYGLGKIMLISSGIGSPISHILFFIIALSLSYRSFYVVTYLKELEKDTSFEEKIEQFGQEDQGQ